MIVAIASAKWDQVDSLETLLGFDEQSTSRFFCGSPSPVASLSIDCSTALYERDVRYNY
jgi:hypothetical protein